MRVIISPAKKMWTDCDSLAPAGRSGENHDIFIKEDVSHVGSWNQSPSVHPAG